MAVEIRTAPSQLMQDLIGVLDEHGVDFLSFTETRSKKRRHGQLQFEEVYGGDKQERLSLNGQKGGEGDDG